MGVSDGEADQCSRLLDCLDNDIKIVPGDHTQFCFWPEPLVTQRQERGRLVSETIWTGVGNWAPKIVPYQPVINTKCASTAIKTKRNRLRLQLQPFSSGLVKPNTNSRSQESRLHCSSAFPPLGLLSRCIPRWRLSWFCALASRLCFATGMV